MTDRLSQVEAALIKADEAGDTEGAKVLAAEVRRLRSENTSLSKPAQAVVGPYEAMAGIASGMGASAVGGIAGLAQGVKNLVSPGMPAGDRVRQVQDALTYQPRTEVGQKAVEMFSYPFEKLAEGARSVGNKVVDATGSPTAATVVDTTIQSAPMILGAAARPVIRSAMERRQAVLDQQKSLNAERDAAINWAKENDIKIDPASANPTILNRWMQGFAGSSKTQLLMSTENVPKWNAIVRRNFGIDDSTPLSPEALEGVRKIAGAEGYEPIRGIGDIKLDPAYFKALDQVEATPVGASKSFNVPPSPLQEAVKIAREPKTAGVFDASAAVDLIKLFREKADSAFKQGENALGKGYKQITKAIEDQIERHLNDPSQYANPVAPDIISKYRDARRTIAQTYDVQEALNGNNVNPQVLAKKWKKGTPLSGDLEEMARFAANFGGAAKPTNKAGGINNPYVQGGWGDLGLGGLSGLGHLLSHGGGAPSATIAALGLMARPAIRAAMASKPYQNAFAGAPSYQPSYPFRLADLLASEELGVPFTAETANRR